MYDEHEARRSTLLRPSYQPHRHRFISSLSLPHFMAMRTFNVISNIVVMAILVVAAIVVVVVNVAVAYASMHVFSLSD